MAGSSAYKGWTWPRPVTPRSLSEWTPTFIVGLAVLMYQVCSNMILLCSGSHLPQSQVADLAVCSGCLEPPFAETVLHSSCLHLLFEEVDLATQRLALFIHSTVLIDFGHKTPIVDSELVECSTECGEGGTAPSQGGYEPCG